MGGAKVWSHDETAGRVTDQPRFLSLDNVLLLHQLSIAEHGGDPGVRDVGLLQSAIAQPQATFGGSYLHEDLATMAAAYVFHIAQNHPFVDGNKRTAAHAAIAFLRANGREVISDEPTFEQTVLGVANGKMKKAEVAEFFRANIKDQF